MQCLHPITITYRDRYKSLEKNGLDTGKFNAYKDMYPELSDNEIISMLYPKSRTVPCGKCAACLSNRRTQWVQRLSYELYHSSNGHFFTLTFDDDHLVYSIDQERPVALMSFVSEFIDKLKSKLFRRQKNPLKYFAVSEYGPSTERPHFHMLLFNLPLDVDLREVEKLWYHGNIKVDHVTGARIGYVTKYCLNKIDPDLWCFDDPEYRPQMRCSKHLGADLLTDPLLSVQYRNGLIDDGYVTNEKFRVPVSRYYKERLLTTYERAKVSERAIVFGSDSIDKLHDRDEYLDYLAKARQLEYKVNKSIKKSQL